MEFTIHSNDCRKQKELSKFHIKTYYNKHIQDEQKLIEISFLVDTGAQVSIINYPTYLKVDVEH